jgi:hypothetical protein
MESLKGAASDGFAIQESWSSCINGAALNFTPT